MTTASRPLQGSKRPPLSPGDGWDGPTGSKTFPHSVPGQLRGTHPYNVLGPSDRGTLMGPPKGLGFCPFDDSEGLQPAPGA